MTNFIQYLIFKFLKKTRLRGMKKSFVHSTSKVESGTSFVKSSMGKYSFCGYDCEIINCEIGSFCSIANNVKIGGGSHPIDWVSTSPVFYKGRDSVTKKFSEFARDEHKKTIIGHDVWIGEGCIIKQGVKIGDGSIIGMGSIVTKDVEEYTIVAGVPAKFVRLRFHKDIIEKLIKIQWWNLDEERLTKAAILIKDPISFINYIEHEN